MNNIDTILSTVNLIQLAESHGAEFKRSNGEWRSACPIHKGSDKTAFVVWEDGKQRWKCFSDKCGGGDVIDYVMAHDHVDLKRAIEILGGGKPITTEEAKQAAEERRQRAEVHAEKKRVEYEQALHELWEARSWERYYENLCANQAARRSWEDRGVPIEFQGFWNLGYCPDFSYRHEDTVYHSPSLTIPIYAGSTNPINVRHRILKPIDPKDKYRPERPGLHAAPFIADYQEIEHDNVLVVEGEIKAMVTYICLDSGEWQVYGIPGKASFRELIEKLNGKRVWIAFDPDAGEQAQQAARMVGGRIISLPMKIDDAINGGALNTISLRRLIRTGRKVS